MTYGYSPSRKWQIFPSLILLTLSVVFYGSLPTIPLMWLATFFHEMSHGLMALLTGGEILHMTLRLDGSGELLHRGGGVILVLSFGYLGEWLSGVMLIWWSQSSSRMRNIWSFRILSIMVLMATVHYGDGMRTMLIGLFLSVMLFCGSLNSRLSSYFMTFLGWSVIVYSLHGTLDLFHYGDNVMTDASLLEKATFIPWFVWAATWISMEVVGLIIPIHLTIKRC